MESMILKAPSVNPLPATTIEIKNASYAVEAIDPGFAGVAAVRVTKLVNGENYAVVLDLEGRATCECPDFVCRHADHGTHCKHIKATLAAGLLVAPISGGSPALLASDVPPITRKDIKRAQAFGIKLPAIGPINGNSSHNIASAKGIESTTVREFVPESSVPSGWGEIEADDEALDPSGDSWEAWDDSTDTPWDLGPEADPIEAPALDLTAFASRSTEPTDAPHGMKWVAIGPSAWVLRSAFPDRVEYPAPVVDEDFLTTDEIVEHREVEAENRRQFYGRKPSSRREPFVPTPEDDALVALMFADRRWSCLAGESGPPIGDKSYPARKAVRPSVNTMTDADVYRAGACS